MVGNMVGVGGPTIRSGCLPISGIFKLLRTPDTDSTELIPCEKSIPSWNIFSAAGGGGGRNRERSEYTLFINELMRYGRVSLGVLYNVHVYCI